MAGISVFIALVLLFNWLGSKIRKRVAGCGLFTDISVHIILQLLFSGSSEGRMAMLFGGVLFNLFLITYRKLRGYSTYTDGSWVEHSGLFYRAKSRSADRSGAAERIPG